MDKCWYCGKPLDYAVDCLSENGLCCACYDSLYEDEHGETYDPVASDDAC